MDKNNAIDLMNFLQDRGYDAELYDDYSGRGMFGSETTGVTTEARPVEMDEMEGAMEDAEIDPHFQKDNMGLDYIYY